MAKFSEANYQSRRIKLSHQIADAQRAYTEATIALELGECDQAAVNAAREQITALKDQLVGVEAAFQRSQAQAVAEKAASERTGRLAAIKAVEASLKKRKAAADDMAEAAAALGAAWQRFEKANADITATAKPFLPDLGMEGIRNLANELTGDFHSAKPYVGHALIDAGLKLSSNHFTESHSRFRGSSNEKAPPLPRYVEERNAVIRRMIEPIEPQDLGAAA